MPLRDDPEREIRVRPRLIYARLLTVATQFGHALQHSRRAPPLSWPDLSAGEATSGRSNDRFRRVRDIGRQGGDGPLATLLSYSDRDSGGQVWVNRVGSRPLKKRLVKANDQSVSILICSSDGCQLPAPQKEAIAY